MSNDGTGNVDYDDVEKNNRMPVGPVESRSRDGGSANTMPVGRECCDEEKQLKCFARNLGRLENFGNQVKTMTVAWASFVLLGAFSNNLAIRDFWFSTIVLLQNKIRFFNNKYEVQEWHCQEISMGSPIWRPPRLFGWRRCMIMLVSLIKMVAAIYFVCKTFSVPARVLVDKGQDANTSIARNKKYSLVLFYILIAIEGLLLLAADIFYLYSIFILKLFHHTSVGLGFSRDDLVPTQGFFVDCLNSSNEDERDMVTFGVDLLASDMRNKQLAGVRILKTFIEKKPDDFSRTVLTNIGANLTATQTLVAMLDWEDRDMFGKHYEDNSETCHSAAVLVLKLTSDDDENAFRVGRLPGSMKTIGCLLEKNRGGFGEEKGSEILASLAKEEESKDRIGRNGKLLKQLFRIFFKFTNGAGHAAGMAIEMLTFEGEINCVRILRLNVLKRLIRAALEDRNLVRRLDAAKILRNLCTYSGASSHELLKGIIDASQEVFKMIVREGDDDAVQGKEIIVGVAAFICKSNSSMDILKEFGVSEDRLAEELVSMLKKYKNDPIITRSAIEVASWMMSGSSPEMVRCFAEKNLEQTLRDILEIMTNKYSEDFEIQFLIETTLELVKQDRGDMTALLSVFEKTWCARRRLEAVWLQRISLSNSKFIELFGFFSECESDDLGFRVLKYQSLTSVCVVDASLLFVCHVVVQS